jgi:predicted permease
MRQLRAWLVRVGGLFRKERRDRELTEELESHLQMQIEDNLRSGMNPADARRQALLKLGGVESAKESYRDRRGFPWIETFLQDIRFGLRMLGKNPGFTSVAVLTLGLGVGVNTAFFGMVDPLLLRPLPVRSPEQITALAFQQKNGLHSIFSIPDYLDIENQTHTVFSGVLGYQVGLDGLTVNGKGDRIQLAYVTGNFFSVLGIKPLMGRLILPSEGEAPGADPVMVLSYSFWKTRFASDPGVVGRGVSVNGHPMTIVGIAPPDFDGVNPLVSFQAYLPLGMAVIGRYPKDFMVNRASRSLYLLGRLLPAISVEKANTTLAVVAQRLSQQHPDTDIDMEMQAFPEVRVRLGAARKDIVPWVAGLFMGLAALVLTLACMNVANLLLVRTMIREREIAIRVALGAGRSRLMRQLLTETLLLASAGAVVGIFFGRLGLFELNSVRFRTVIPFRAQLSLDWRTFSYAFVVALLAGIAAGTFPAVRVLRGKVSPVLRDGGRAVPKTQRVRSVIAVCQVSASLMLLIIAGLFTRSLHDAERTNLGFIPNHVLNLSMDPNEIGYSQAQTLQFYRNVLDRISTLPGVSSVSVASSVPMSAVNRPEQPLSIDGYQPRTGEIGPSVPVAAISPDYFKTLAIPLIAGRTFTAADDEGSPTAAIVNQAMADRFWPRQDPLGRRFSVKGVLNHPFEVVGVVKDFRYQDMTSPIEPHFFIPYAQTGFSLETLQIRATGDPEIMPPEIERVIAGIAPGLPIFNAQTMTQALDTTGGLLMFRLSAVLAGALGILGVILSVVGVYGVISYAVTQRTREIGIRMALGAKSSDILKVMLKQGIFIVSMGLITGLAAAFAAAHLVGRFLIVSATDPLTYLIASAALSTVVLVACYTPALRATRVDPIVALRHE